MIVYSFITCISLLYGYHQTCIFTYALLVVLYVRGPSETLASLGRCHTEVVRRTWQVVGGKHLNCLYERIVKFRDGPKGMYFGENKGNLDQLDPA